MSNPTIEVTGRARKDVEAESYELEFEIEAEADRANDARARANDRQGTVTDAIEAVSDAVSVDLRSGFVGESASMFDADEDAAFVARRTVEVHCPTDVVEDVVAAGVQSGALLEDVDPAASSTTRAAVRGDLLEAATERAREDAERTAAAAGHEIAGLDAMETRESGPFDALGGDDGFFDGGFEHEAGVVEIGVAVDVTYAITPTGDDA
ncbi:SIMPL domain-containing protein [Halorubellus litoreus]|uniref:SIMPL domain-containing protein n=1 Tax=Halorubellus litoreus TaxID=755308 RepID=A0ABD5VMV4_9EURY